MAGAGGSQPEVSDEVDVFGRYHLIAKLGSGGTADVFLAVARGAMGFNELVVLKRLRAPSAESQAVLQMFLDEARLAAPLAHHNIVQTYEVGVKDGAYFLAMEYLEGQPLDKLVALRRGAREVHRADVVPHRQRGGSAVFTTRRTTTLLARPRATATATTCRGT